MFRHLTLYYHKDGYVEISLELYNTGERSKSKEPVEVLIDAS
jgi:hypothetical protein